MSRSVPPAPPGPRPTIFTWEDGTPSHEPREVPFETVDEDTTMDTAKGLVESAEVGDRTRPVLTVLSGLQAGRIVELDQEEAFIGRSSSVAVRLDDAGVSRKHARLRRWIGKAFVLEDLSSTNGTFVNARRIERCTIRPGDRIQLGSQLLLRFDLLDPTEAALQRQLFEGNVREPSTRLYTRQHLEDQLRLEIASSRRHQADLALLLVAVDDPPPELKLDREAVPLLKDLAACVAECGRIEDLIARYDHDTIALLCRGMTAAAARTMAKEIQITVGTRRFSLGGAPQRLSVSVGLCALGQLHIFSEHSVLLEKAREQLYEARAQGRSRVSAPPLEED